MGIKVFLDDNRPTPEGWVRAHTAEDVKLHLLHRDVDDLSLDYDLDNPECPTCQFQCGLREGGCQRGCDCHSAGDETGLDLVQWMRDTGHWPKNQPAVHSHNLMGALRMKKMVQDHFPRVGKDLDQAYESVPGAERGPEDDYEPAPG